MATKIQLRGISRTPSDKMSAEGGLAESLNFRIDNGESTPMVPATDLTSQSGTFASIGLPPVSANLAYNVLYLHKQNNYRNFICSQVVSNQTKVGIWTNPSTDTYTLSAFLTLPQGESVKDVVAIGNTLVIYTDVSSYYVIYRNGAYELLGSKIPAPVVRIIGSGSNKKRDSLMDIVYNAGNKERDFVETTSGYYMKYLTKSTSQISNPSSLGLTAANVKSMYSSLRSGSGYFYAPTFLRVAVKLYDGYTNQSAPICVAAGQNYSPDIFILETKYGREEDYTYYYHACIRINRTNPRIQLFNETDLEKWDDIIQSIDVFATEPVENPGIALDETTTAISGYGDAVWSGTNFRTFDVIMDGQYTDAAKIEELALSKNVFKKVLAAVKVSSIYDDDITTTWDALANTSTHGALIKYPTLDQLYLRDELPDDYDSNATTIADNAIVFNNRLVLSGVKQLLGSGTTCFFAPASSGDGSAYDIRYRVKYFVTSDSSDNIADKLAHGDASSVLGRSYSGEQFAPTSWAVGSATKYEETFGWISYPHPNCKSVILEVLQGSTVLGYLQVEMKQHPKLSCSYAFFGFGKTLGWRYDILQNLVVVDDTQGTVLSGMTSAEFQQADPYLPYLNKMFYSEASNPFSFPVAYRKTFDSDVITCRVANKPLSQGETGKFPLYVFTKGGIYTMETTSLGTFNPPVNVSRDVALNARSVKSIDQAVIFTTAKGVMLISGGDISCLSTEMVGKRYVLETEAQTILNADENAWKKYLPILTDTTAFMDFMGNALYAYDYAGGRLICFNADKPYAYVYSLSSSTWHTLALPENLIVRNVLNTYPETYASFDTDIIYWKIDPISDATKRQSVSQAIYYDCELGYSEEEISAMLETSGITIDEDLIDDEYDLENALTVAGASYSIQNATHVFDYSTYLDVESDTANSGVIVTRPFDLGAPDVRKVIKDLRIRGRFNKADVKYLLFGSMDGIKFGRLSSLRGASCKSFRLALLAKLTQAEKISYVEIEYGERFRNKLR